MKLFEKHNIDIPMIALVAANAIPLWGVLYLGWDVFYIVLLYWLENLVIGFYNVLKIAFAKAPDMVGHVSKWFWHLGKLFLIPFFMVHYGGFMAVHGMFILFLLKGPKGLEGGGPATGPAWPCFFVFLQMLIGVVRHVYLIIPPQVKVTVLALFVSHGISFVYHYLLGGEYATAKPKDLMSGPYSRIVVMHITILGGAFLLAVIRSPAALLIVLVLMKTIMDIKLHIRSHNPATAAADEQP